MKKRVGNFESILLLYPSEHILEQFFGKTKDLAEQIMMRTLENNELTKLRELYPSSFDEQTSYGGIIKGVKKLPISFTDKFNIDKSAFLFLVE